MCIVGATLCRRTNSSDSEPDELERGVKSFVRPGRSDPLFEPHGLRLNGLRAGCAVRFNLQWGGDSG